MNKVELLAPAGSLKCLKAAVESGANAVYFAGKSFGARSFAENLSNSEIEEGISYCCKHNVKAYTAVNTLVNNREIDKITEFLKFLSDVGADAVIVQDLAVAELAKSLGLRIHASTQMSIHNLEGAKALERLGFDRVILARELSKENIRHIKKYSAIELEVFVHGALCVSYSGQCLMSSFIGGRSANRGKCAGPCRLPYSAGGERQKAYNLSLKDLSLINRLQELKDIGVASLKIEGRMKGSDYVSGVTRMYRKYLDNSLSPDKEDIAVLEKLFYRGGYTDGYFNGGAGKGKSMFAPNKPDNPYDVQRRGGRRS